MHRALICPKCDRRQERPSSDRRRGAYGTLSEIGHALAEDIPVFGLRAWELARDGRVDGRIVVASDPEDAVKLAVEAASLRTGASPIAD